MATNASLHVHGCGSSQIAIEVFLLATRLKSEESDLTLSQDAIGQIVSIEGVGEAWKWKTWSNIPFRNICSRDLRYRCYFQIIFSIFHGST